MNERAPSDSDRPVIPHPAYDVLTPSARALADVIQRPTMSKAIAEKLGPELTARLTVRIAEIAARASLTADDKTTAELLDHVMSESLTKIEQAAAAHREKVRDLLEGDEPDVDSLTRERFTGVSRG